jgi:hypothetical protein
MMTRASDEIAPMPWRPPRWEKRSHITRVWLTHLTFDAGAWAIGFRYDIAPIGFSFECGPLFVGFERDEPPPENYDALPNWSWVLKRIVIRKLKMELRFELNLRDWSFGCVMADHHDVGVYLGPVNLQAEYYKLYDYPRPRPGDAFGLLTKVLFGWLETAALVVPINVQPSRHADQRIVLSFEGITPAIGAFLTCWELSVFVDWQGRNWDTLLSLDVKPRRRARGGYTCECCQRRDRRVFPSLDALWRDHLFEPFGAWVNGELAVADTIGLTGSPSVGYTHAKLLTKADPRPEICVPVRVTEQP